jgi:trans-2,3-dihydro-3-hydroxyanthranilate isomerase
VGDVITLSYEVVDVFTDRPFTGNPLAVVFGAESLATEQLQTITREFNLSETIFVVPSTVPEATYRARIFTPAHELPFAGHPSVGAAVTQLRRGLIEAGDVVMECGAGLLPIHVDEAGRATVTGATPTLGEELDPGDLLAAVGLTRDDYRGPAPRWAGCGVEFPFLHVTPEAVARAIIPLPRTVDTIAVFAWDPQRRESHTRVMSPGHGVPEDPATGSAALAFGVWLVGSGLLPGDGLTKYTVRQGLEIHRPSTLGCSVNAVGAKAVQATVTGHVVPIASGEIAIPPFVG